MITRGGHPLRPVFPNMHKNNNEIEGVFSLNQFEVQNWTRRRWSSKYLIESLSNNIPALEEMHHITRWDFVFSAGTTVGRNSVFLRV